MFNWSSRNDWATCSTTFVSTTSPMHKCNSTAKHGTGMWTAIAGLMPILQSWEKDGWGNSVPEEEATHRMHSFTSHESKPCSSTARKTGFKYKASLTSCWLKVSLEATARHTERRDARGVIYSGSEAGKKPRVSVSCAHTVWLSLPGGTQPCHRAGPYIFPKSRRYLNTVCGKGLSGSTCCKLPVRLPAASRSLSVPRLQPLWLHGNFEGAGSNNFMLRQRSEKF